MRDNLVDVVGAGTMGIGIAQVAAAAGHPVLLYDAVPGAAERAVSLVDNRVLAATIAGRSWRALELTKLALLFDSDDKHTRMTAFLERSTR